MFFTQNEELKKSDDYKKIVTVLNKLDQSGVMWLGRGHCISMSEIIRTALSEIGVNSRIVECQLMIINNVNDPPFISTVGYDGVCNPGEIDTHVVCVTDTKIPIIIDGSIGHRLPESNRIVIEELISNSNRVFCESTLNGIKLVYQQKSNPKVAMQYQKSILERIETDKNVFYNIGFLKTLVAIALVVSTLNAVRGFYDFYQKYYNSEAQIGVSAFEDMNERFDILETMIKNNVVGKQQN